MAFVTLLRPPVMVAVKSPVSPTCPPVGLAYIAASLVEGGHKVAVVDALGEAPAQFLACADPRFTTQGLTIDEILARIDTQTEVLGVSCMFSYEWPNVRQLLNKLREHLPLTKFVLGGEHASALPDFCLRDCAALDVCVIGEGEETMLELLSSNFDFVNVKGIAYREDNEIRRTLSRQRIKAVDEIAKPAWDLFPLENYLAHGYGRGVNRGRNMPLLSSRGCPYRCTFCSNESMWTPRWIARKPALVLEEIKEYLEKYKVNNFDFYDLTAIVNRNWIIEFCQMIIESKLKFTWQLASGTRSEALDSEVSKLLYQAGCVNVSYAPESGSEAVLKRIQKKIDLEKMKQSMRDSVKNGVICKANVLIGFPGETHREIWDSLGFCIQAALTGIHDLSIYPFSPYPGSKLFQQLIDEGKIPAIDDSYFYSLALSTELGASSPSFSENVSDSFLGFYRIFGIALFYLSSFFARPWRAVQMVRNVFGETQETLLESALHNKFMRGNTIKR